MISNRSSSIIVGSLFITATAGYIGGQAVYRPLLDATDYLATIDLQRPRLVAGTLIELVGILAIPLIAAFIFPILKRLGEGLAFGYLALRTIEALLLLTVVVNVLSLADVSRGYLEAGSMSDPHWENLGAALQLANEWPFLLSVGVVFPLGALLLNFVLYRGRLVPPGIAIWGVLGAALLLLGSLLDMFGALPTVSRTTLEIIVSGPIAIQEMVLAGWLIFRGFHICTEASPRPGTT